MVQEISQRIRYFKVNAVCPECNKGVLVFNSYVRTTRGKIPHKCDNCNNVEFLDKAYPFIRSEEGVPFIETNFSEED